MKRILVHMCCGPCSIFPLRNLLSKETELWGFFFNPNIQPRDEFNKRLEATRTLARLMELDVIFHDSYQVEDFLRDRTGVPLRELPKEARCEHCYDLRLEATAKAAAEEGFDMFTSSLLYSRYQDHGLIRDIAEKYAKVYNVEFFYRDFRTGWQEGIKESKEMGLYRQQYCGCIFSWMERYNKLPAKMDKAL